MTLESYALGQVRPGQVVGLGSGRAAERFVRALAARVEAGLEVRGVPTSRATEDLARTRPRTWLDACRATAQGHPRAGR
jgi:ribose 5-phosphate isomerase A